MSRPLVDTLRALSDARKQLQKLRIAEHNRVWHLEAGRDTDTRTSMALKVHRENLEMLEQLEGEYEKRMRRVVRYLLEDEPVMRRLLSVKGVGEVYAGELLARIDIERADTISALWRFCGYAVVDGVAERPKRGEKLHYCARLKTTCYVILTSFLKCKESPYKDYYYAQRARYEASRPDWSKGRVHMAAARKTIKLFLAHLWLVWRRELGLPVRDPYAIANLGHSTVLPPEDFGWYGDAG